MTYKSLGIFILSFIGLSGILIWFFNLEQDEKILRRTVKVIVLSNGIIKQGTGYFINKNKILTAYHLAQSNSEIILIQEYNSYLLNKARLLKSRKNIDLSLLILDNYYGRYPIVKMNFNFKLNDPVCAVGMVNKAWDKRCGRIEDLSYAENYSLRDKLFIQISSGVITPGFSGGPVLNQKNELIGIVSFMNILTGSGYAISTLDIVEFLKDVSL